MLSSTSGYSIQHLVNKFHKLLNSPPDLPVFDQSGMEVAYLLIDGLWFGRHFVLMAYRQSKNLLLLKISVAKREVSTKIIRDLRALVAVGYRFSGIVSDDGTGIVKAVRAVFPHSPHQICLAHMHRRIVSMLGKKPKDERIQELRMLADHVWLIESKQALRDWYVDIENWYRRNFNYLRERRIDQFDNWWYIHKGARKAIRILLVLPKRSFKFLDYPLMPKTTNELEAQFGHLGKRWLAHRGLKTERWENFMRWFVYFYNQEKLSRSKKH